MDAIGPEVGARVASGAAEGGTEGAELFVNDTTRKHITFYDLRATGITWMAVRGDDAQKIQHRAGHESFSTTQGYIREAENLQGGFGQPFPSLPATLMTATSSWPLLQSAH